VTCDVIRESRWRPGQPIHLLRADLRGSSGNGAGRVDEPVAEAENDVDDEVPTLNMGGEVKPSPPPSGHL